MKNMFKFSFVLAAYTVVACVGLAFVYNITSPIISAAAAAELQAALVEVFPEATDFEDVSLKLESGNNSIVFNKAYLAKSAGATLGMVVQVTGPTYSSATMLLGIEIKGALKPVKFMALTDTPGLGSKAKEEPFKGQFTGKSVNDAFVAGTAKAGADIIAISGATITSRGVSKIVKLTGTAARDYLSTVKE